MTMSKLAVHEAVAKPSATGIVGRLFDKGLVVREPDPEDGRSSIVAISPEGIEALHARRRGGVASMTRRIEALDDADRAMLERAVTLLELMIEDR